MTRFEHDVQDAEWDFEDPVRTEIGKWIQDIHGQLHYEHGMEQEHAFWLRNAVSRTTRGRALSAQSTTTAHADVPRSSRHQYSHEANGSADRQGVRPVTLQNPISQNPNLEKGNVFALARSTGGHDHPPHMIHPITGVAGSRGKSHEGYVPNMILVAEHLQPEDSNCGRRE